jgi:hypothetical protein
MSKIKQCDGSPACRVFYFCDISRLCMYEGFLGIATFDDEAIGPNVINVLSIRSVKDL